MSSLKLNGSTSGYVEIVPPAVAGNNSVTLPSGSGTLVTRDSGGNLTITGVTTVSAGSTAAPSITPSGDSNTGIFFPAADTIAFGEGGAEAARFDSNGRFGLGTVSPGSLLDVRTTGVTSRFVSTNGNNNQIALSNAADGTFQFFIGSAGLDIFQFSNSAGIERARIDSSGRLLLGTSSNSSTDLDSGPILQAYKSSGSASCLIKSDSVDTYQFVGYQAITASRSAYLGVTNVQNVGTKCAFVILQQAGGSNGVMWVDDSANLRISNSIVNVGTTNGTVVGTQTSDGRIKNILGPVNYGLETVKQIEPVRFTLKTEPETEKLGFIAQQVQPLVPECVFDTKEQIEGEPEDAPTKLGMEYVSLVPVLVNAIKELSARGGRVERTTPSLVVLLTTQKPINTPKSFRIMTEQQQHLAQLLQQRAQLDTEIAKNRELFWKVQGAIEYLTQTGVTLPEPEVEEKEETTEE